MVRNFKQATQAQVPFNKSANVTVIFMLQADTERVQKEKRCSFEVWDAILDISVP
jgi:hypothetical protein